MSQAAKEPTVGAGCATELCPKLVEIYDELSEVFSLNCFLYDAFLNIAAEENVLPLEAGTLTGLSIISRWVRQRQRDLKEQLQALCRELGVANASRETDTGSGL